MGHADLPGVTHQDIKAQGQYGVYTDQYHDLLEIRILENKRENY
jgi:hypothetical protein